MSVETLSIHTISVQQNNPTPDRKGNVPDNWEAKYTDIKARIMSASANEQAKWGGVPTMLTHVIYIPDATQDIKEKDRIIFGSRTFDVLGSRNIDEWDKFLTINCREIR